MRKCQAESKGTPDIIPELDAEIEKNKGIKKPKQQKDAISKERITNHEKINDRYIPCGLLEIDMMFVKI
jgi:hypothetical protein